MPALEAPECYEPANHTVGPPGPFEHESRRLSSAIVIGGGTPASGQALNLRGLTSWLIHDEIVTKS